MDKAEAAEVAALARRLGIRMVRVKGFGDVYRVTMENPRWQSGGGLLTEDTGLENFTEWIRRRAPELLAAGVGR